MKRIFKDISIVMLLVGNAINAIAASQNSTTTLSKLPKESNEHRNPKGRRVPSEKIVCTISYIENTIDTSLPIDVLVYELLDEEGVVLMASYPSAYEMTQFMSNITGTYQLRLETDDYLYSGFIEL